MARAVGLLLSARLTAGSGLLLTRTSAITTLGMRFRIDVVFVDMKWRVVDVEPALAQWVPVRLSRAADAIFELPVGALAASGTQVGDELEVETVP